MQYHIDTQTSLWVNEAGFLFAELYLKDISFLIDYTLRQEALDKNIRTIHAWIIGTPITKLEYDSISTFPREVIYNPIKHECFLTEQGCTSGASYAKLCSNRKVLIKD